MYTKIIQNKSIHTKNILAIIFMLVWTTQFIIPIALGTEYILDNSKIKNDDNIKSAIKIAESAMQAQSSRLKVIAQNIANADVTSSSPYQDPYRRKIIFFKNSPDDTLNTNIVTIDKIDTDKSQFLLKYEPTHPAADQNGYVKYPNVNIIIENVDAKEAERSFNVNTNSLSIAKSLAHKTLEIMK